MKKQIILFLFSILFLTCTPQQERLVMTVSGPMPADELGITLPHEHLLVDFIGADSTGYFRWDRDKVVQKVLPFLLEIKQFGVKSFIDCTPAYLGRDPWLLQELAEKSGISILTTTGYYGAYQNKFVPSHAFDMSHQELAELWIDEYKNGIEGTSVRPGIIKISVERNQPLSPMHKKIVTAAAITHLATGLTIVSHTGPESAAYEQVAVLDSMGVSPNAFVWTHANEGSHDAHVDLAQKGVWISLDKVNVRLETIQEMVDALKNLKEHNLLTQVLFSHDAGWYDPAKPGGGQFRPFTSIFTHLIPALKENGFTDAEIDMMMRENPQKAFSIKVRTGS